MKTRYLFKSIRWALTIFLLVLVFKNVHWSVGICLTLITFSIEGLAAALEIHALNIRAQRQQLEKEFNNRHEFTRS